MKEFIKCEYCKKDIVKGFKEYTEHINTHDEQVKMLLFASNLINMMKNNGA